MSSESLVWLLAVPVLIAIVYSSLRGWSRFNEETGLNLVKKLRRSASPTEVAAVADEITAVRLDRIRSLRERARSDPNAAGKLRRLLETEIRAREQVLESLQSTEEPNSGFLEAAKSSTRQEILELKGIQQELGHSIGG